MLKERHGPPPYYEPPSKKRLLPPFNALRNLFIGSDGKTYPLLVEPKAPKSEAGKMTVDNSPNK